MPMSMPVMRIALLGRERAVREGVWCRGCHAGYKTGLVLDPIDEDGLMHDIALVHFLNEPSPGGQPAAFALTFSLLPLPHVMPPLAAAHDHRHNYLITGEQANAVFIVDTADMLVYVKTNMPIDAGGEVLVVRTPWSRVPAPAPAPVPVPVPVTVPGMRAHRWTACTMGCSRRRRSPR